MENPNMAPSFSRATEDLKNMISELRHDLMSAQTQSDLDLELAFNLQMEEAIKASIALKPPTSSSSSSSHGLKRRGQEVERLEQECRDREMKKMRDDRNHNGRIHDQKVANGNLTIREDDRQRYGAGECSRSTAMEDENVRVYIKGLVSEERVRDSTITVAAIGVAIYGSKDNLILEVSKPLVDVDKKKSLMDPVEVGFQALIEGLNAVIALGLKSVTCFCDDYMIHQYVTAKLPPPQPWHNLFIDTVLLRTKFAKFNMSLVAQNDNKLAFKLARDAIVSQITWASGRGKNLLETCIICFEDTAVNKMFTLDCCLHRFCFSCMKRHVKVKMLNGMMAKCPREGCKSEVNIDRCREFLEPKSVELMRQRIKEASIAVTERVYCPNPRCSALMSKSEVLEYTNKYMGKARQSCERKCTECRGNFCINCKVPWHNSMTCDAYKRSNLYQSAEDAKLKSLATEKRWRQCVKCSHMVELSEGCYHIRCRCGYEFCYTCGAEWKNKNATCTCPLWIQVTGRLPPPPMGKTTKLITEVKLLQTKFENLTLSLVARTDIKFAVKLARDSIVSQLTTRSGMNHVMNLMDTCIICFEDTAVYKMFAVDGCLHRFCLPCMKQHVEVKLLNGKMAKCPHIGCKSEVNIDKCEAFLEPKLIEKIRQHMKEASIPVTEKVYCPNPRCSALMSKCELLEDAKKYIFGAAESGERRCTKCDGFFCVNCKVPWHYSMTCDGYKRSNLYQSAEDAKLKSLASKKLWRQCVKCSHMVELGEGCYHIYCRCGHEFCYTCGAEWKDKKATCKCPLWAERNILYNNRQRRG